MLTDALDLLRCEGETSCRRWLERQHWPSSELDHRDQPLLEELMRRLRGEPAPHLLVDALWLQRPTGGITRVWEQILTTWSLPGLVSAAAPITLIDREGRSALLSRFALVEQPPLDPLDVDSVAGCSDANGRLATELGAQVFLSSWITVCGEGQPVCPELALVHDCMPERSQTPEPLRRQRRRWLTGASAHLAVSAATATDLEGLLQRPLGSIPWWHPAAASCFLERPEPAARERLWANVQRASGLTTPLVVLPATSSIGSYKNPELVAAALGQPGLEQVQLVVCGVAADRHAQALEQAFPFLQGRVVTACFTDLELAEVYRRALAVVVPSRIEGFGLPVVEALAAGGVVIRADARGLREAGGGAAPCVDVDDPAALARWLRLLMDRPSQAWLQPHLRRRWGQRQRRLQPDRLGLALLAQARTLAG